MQNREYEYRGTKYKRADWEVTQIFSGTVGNPSPQVSSIKCIKFGVGLELKDMKRLETKAGTVIFKNGSVCGVQRWD